MTAIPTRRRRRTTLALASGVVATVLVLVGGYVGADAIYNSKGSVRAAEDTIGLPSTPTALFATVDESDRLTSLTAFVLGASGRGGSIVPLPANGDATAGAGPDRVSFAQVYAAGGKPDLVAAVESVLSLTFGYSEVVDAAGAAALLQPVGHIVVDLPAVVVDAVGSGAPTIVLTEGEHALSGDNTAVILTSHAAGLKEAARRPGIDAFWHGVVEAIGGGRPGGPLPSGGPSSFADLLARLYAGSTQTRSLRVLPFLSADNPTGADVELIDRPFAVFLFATAAPGSMSASAPGYVYRVEAPSGYEAEVEAVIAALLYLEANVSSVNITAEPQADTVAYVSSDSLQLDEQIMSGLFGTLTVKPIDQRIDGIDIDLVLGTTFLDAARTNPPVPSSTTTVADADE